MPRYSHACNLDSIQVVNRGKKQFTGAHGGARESQTGLILLLQSRPTPLSELTPKCKDKSIACQYEVTNLSLGREAPVSTFMYELPPNHQSLIYQPTFIGVA